MIDQILIDLNQRKDISFSKCRAMFLEIFKGNVPEQIVKTVLILLAQKGESADEVGACVAALEKLEPKLPFRISNLIDTCGTGGDGSHSINISTLSALVIAGAGGKVAKHGNRSISSKCGSSDLLEALGVNLSAPVEKMVRSIKKHGIGYFHAPFYHPVFSKIQPLRKRLGVRTVLNYLGPMVNPMRLDYQITGTPDPRVSVIYASILRRKRLKKAWVFSTGDRMDELSLCAANSVLEIERNKKLKRFSVTAKTFGMKSATRNALTGGTASQNKILATKLLNGKLKGAMNDIVILNAAGGLVVSGLCSTMKAGVTLAKRTIESGHALKTLEGLIEVTN